VAIVPTPRKFSEEMRQRAKRLVREVHEQEQGCVGRRGRERIGRS
jgi:hypothetical protein